VVGKVRRIDPRPWRRQAPRQVQRCNKAPNKSRGVTANGKGGCRCTSPTGIRRPGGHEAQAQEAEKEGRIKKEARRKDNELRDAGATRACGKDVKRRATAAMLRLKGKSKEQYENPPRRTRKAGFIERLSGGERKCIGGQI